MVLQRTPDVAGVPESKKNYSGEQYKVSSYYHMDSMLSFASLDLPRLTHQSVIYRVLTMEGGFPVRMHTSYPDHSDPANTFTIGEWSTFKSGPFAGRTMRVTLQEIQKAEVGRKYCRKDKRPLDPPPVVRLRCYEAVYSGSTYCGEIECMLESEDMIFGLVCHADLFPVPHAGAGGASPGSPLPQQFPFGRDASILSLPQSSNAFLQPGTNSRGDGVPGIPRNSVGSFQLETHEMHALRLGRNSSEFLPQHVDTPWNMRPKELSIAQLPALPDSLQYLEGSTCTWLLAGETFTPCSVIEHEGNKMAVFVFSDIAVRHEGHYILRYRVFSIEEREHHDYPTPVLAESYGGVFEVYSTKTFPGLQASTALTKVISTSGIQVHSRKKERTRRRKPGRGDQDRRIGPSSTQRSSVPLRVPDHESMDWPQPARLPHNALVYGEPSSAGPSNADVDRSRAALAAWARTSAASGFRVQDEFLRDGSCSAGSEQDKIHSLW